MASERHALSFTRKAWGYLQDMKNATLLDIGCGDGRDSIFFAEKGLTVTAIDSSEEAIARVRASNVSVDARVMDILRMDFEDQSFDAIFAHLSIHYFTDEVTDRVITNIHRMLKPGGYFFVRCKSTDDSLYGQGKEIEKDVYRLEYDRHFFSEEYLRQKLQHFQILELQSTESVYVGKKSYFVEAVSQK